MTRDEAQCYIGLNFTRGEVVQSPRNTSTWRVWTERWLRKDDQPVSQEDRAAFELVPRGQRHRVASLGAVVTLHCECDSGD